MSIKKFLKKRITKNKITAFVVIAVFAVVVRNPIVFLVAFAYCGGPASRCQFNSFHYSIALILGFLVAAIIYWFIVEAIFAIIAFNKRIKRH